MTFPNASKAKALTILLDETYSHIRQNMYESYKDLAFKNSKVRNVQSNYFRWDGIIYPMTTQNGTPNATLKIPNVPNLDVSLLIDFQEIQDRLEKADMTSIKNFFSAVISHSFNSLVLKEFIPQVLLQTVQSKLGATEFKAIDHGTYDGQFFESIEDTKTNITMIHEQYGQVAKNLKILLMDRLLLSR